MSVISRAEDCTRPCCRRPRIQKAAYLKDLLVHALADSQQGVVGQPLEQGQLPEEGQPPSSWCMVQHKLCTHNDFRAPIMVMRPAAMQRHWGEVPCRSGDCTSARTSCRVQAPSTTRNAPACTSFMQILRIPWAHRPYIQPQLKDHMCSSGRGVTWKKARRSKDQTVHSVAATTLAERTEPKSSAMSPNSQPGVLRIFTVLPSTCAGERQRHACQVGAARLQSVACKHTRMIPRKAACKCAVFT